MSLPLVLTKFNVPPTGDKYILRPRLMRLLDECLEMRAALVLVCGPAGSGKTTVVSDWLLISKSAPALHYAWLTLEPSDDEATRFLAYFIAALRRIQPDFGTGVLKLLQTHKPSPLQTLATLLVNELSEIPQDFLLVLDDFHLTSSESIRSFIEFIIEHQPPCMKLALITRADPLLPLARLRAKRRLIELRQDDLRFTPDEASEFLFQVMGLTLTSDQIALLEKYTEGWITGLQLAALSMRNLQDRLGFLETFSGENKFIADYLTDEVLAQLPESMRSFLLRTSILEGLSAPLCEAVTGQGEARAVLDQLLDANLFIVPLDNQQTWYRYHTLFADLLHKRLQDVPDEDVRVLHRRASHWHQEHGLVESAIRHSLEAQDYERAAALIEQVAEMHFRFGEASIVLVWLDRLPKETILAHPKLGSLKGFALILCNRPTELVAELVSEMSTTAGQDDFQGEVTTLRALSSILQGRSSEAIQLAEQALDQLPVDRIFFRILAADSLAMAYTLAGDIEAAIGAFRQVVELAEQSDNVMMALMALTNLAGLRYVQGHLQSAISACRQVLDMADRRIGRQTPMLGRTLFNLGEMLREQGDLETALKYLQDAAGMLEHFSEAGLPLATLGIARIKMNQADWLAAQTCIDKARQQALANQTILMSERLVDLMQARYWIARGELEPAGLWARKCGLQDKSPMQVFGDAGRNAVMNELLQGEYLTLIRLTLAQRQPGKALEMITFLLDLVEKRGYGRRIIECLVLQAVALQQSGEIEPAMVVLKKALALAEPEGYQRTFIDEGEPMTRLLYQVNAQKESNEYAARLLSILITQAPAARSTEQSRAAGLIEPLSEREREVLGLIAQGLTNAEIAGRLVISLSTVKGHTSNIFGKLSVKNRSQAIAQARRLGLLTAD